MTPPLPAAFLHAPLAHRGLHDMSANRPENTLAAIRAAADVGYGIEIDVQLSLDGRAMVFHDYRLDRLTSATGPTCAQTSQALQKLNVLGTGERVPTLLDALAAVAGRAALLIEIKDQDEAMGPNVGALEAAVARDLHGYDGPVAVMSFNPYSVAAIAELSRDTPRGIVTAHDETSWAPLSEARRTELREIRDLEKVEAAFISHDAEDLHSSRVAELRASGTKVLCWTIRNPEQERRARKYADNITFEGYPAPLVPA